MAIRVNADGSITVGILPEEDKKEQVEVSAPQPKAEKPKAEKKPTKKK